MCPGGWREAGRSRLRGEGEKATLPHTLPARKPVGGCHPLGRLQVGFPSIPDRSGSGHSNARATQSVADSGLSSWTAAGGAALGPQCVHPGPASPLLSAGCRVGRLGGPSASQVPRV